MKIIHNFRSITSKKIIHQPVEPTETICFAQGAASARIRPLPNLCLSEACLLPSWEVLPTNPGSRVPNILLWREEILHHLAWLKPTTNNVSIHHSLEPLELPLIPMEIGAHLKWMNHQHGELSISLQSIARKKSGQLRFLCFPSTTLSLTVIGCLLHDQLARGRNSTQDAATSGSHRIPWCENDEQYCPSTWAGEMIWLDTIRTWY